MGKEWGDDCRPSSDVAAMLGAHVGYFRLYFHFGSFYFGSVLWKGYDYSVLRPWIVE